MDLIDTDSLCIEKCPLHRYLCRMRSWLPLNVYGFPHETKNSRLFSRRYIVVSIHLDITTCPRVALTQRLDKVIVCCVGPVAKGNRK